jgi:hypothetical protein
MHVSVSVYKEVPKYPYLSFFDAAESCYTKAGIVTSRSHNLVKAARFAELWYDETAVYIMVGSKEMYTMEKRIY